MNIELTTKLLTAREFLQAIGQISFSYTQLNRQFPLVNLSQNSGEDLLMSYNNLILKVIHLSNENEHERNAQ